MRRVYWQEVSELVKQADPPLWQLIQAINPSNDFPLFLSTYHYGDLIVQNGEMQYSASDKTLRSFEDLSPDAQSLLDKTVLPVSLLLSKTAEVFSCESQRIVPLNILKTGQFFGLFELFSPKFLEFNDVNISAGVRTTFMLPNVSDATHHKKLMTVYKAPDIPKSLFDHWDIFNKIANYRFHNRYWQCQVLLFTNAWIEKFQQPDSIAWLALKNYLLECAWRHARHLVHHYNKVQFKKIILEAAARSHVNLNEYALNSILQVLLIQYGKLPGFRVSDGGEEYLPERTIQEAYIQDYKLKSYLPIIMHADMWEGAAQAQPIYYSINLPTFINGVLPDMKNLRRTELLQQIHLVLDNVALPGQYAYQFLHHHIDYYQAIQRAEDVLVKDPRVVNLQQHYPERSISSSNPFMKGCIQIASKDTAFSTADATTHEAVETQT